MATEKTYGPEKPASLPSTPVPPKQSDPVPTPGMPKTPREALEMERKARKSPPVFVEAHTPGDFDEPFKVAEPRELTEAEAETKKQREELTKQVADILAKYDHRESSIPPGHEYWALVAKLRAL